MYTWIGSGQLIFDFGIVKYLSTCFTYLRVPPQSEDLTKGCVCLRPRMLCDRVYPIQQLKTNAPRRLDNIQSWFWMQKTYDDHDLEIIKTKFESLFYEMRDAVTTLRSCDGSRLSQLLSNKRHRPRGELTRTRSVGPDTEQTAPHCQLRHQAWRTLSVVHGSAIISLK